MRLFQGITLTDEMIRWAEQKAEEHARGRRFDPNMDLQNSVRIGYLGDACFKARYPEALHFDLSEFDYFLNGLTTDTKTYRSDFKPREDYLVQIPKIDVDRGKGDIYFFVCLNEKIRTGWLVGWQYCKDFLAAATYRRKGEVRMAPSRIEYKADCFEVSIGSLKDPEELK